MAITRTPVRLSRAVSGCNFSVRGCSRGSRISSRCTIISGNSTRNVAPRPSPSLATCTDPPCISTMCRTIERPSPRPPAVRVRPVSFSTMLACSCAAASSRDRSVLPRATFDPFKSLLTIPSSDESTMWARSQRQIVRNGRHMRYSARNPRSN